MHTEFEILEALFRAYDAHDLEQVASLYAANATHVDIAAGRPRSSRGSPTHIGPRRRRQPGADAPSVSTS